MATANSPPRNSPSPSNARSNSPLIAIGSASSSSLVIWDANNQGVDFLDLGKAIPRKPARKDFYTSLSQPRQLQPGITGMSFTGNWWTVAGGQYGHRKLLDGGFLATFHGPSRSLACCTPTRECIQHLASFSVTADQTRDTRLVSVGNEAVVSFWESSFSLRRTHRVWSGRPSSTAIAVLPSQHGINGGKVAIAGVGSSVSVLEDFCITVSLEL